MTEKDLEEMERDTHEASSASLHAVCRYHIRQLVAEVRRLQAGNTALSKDFGDLRVVNESFIVALTRAAALIREAAEQFEYIGQNLLASHLFAFLADYEQSKEK